MDENKIRLHYQQMENDMGEEMPSKKTVAIDFDGVLHQYSQGWQGGVIYDPPNPGTEEALAELYQKFRLVVYTVRDDLIAVGDWLEKHGLRNYIDRITNDKPIAVLYIDDRALRFSSWTQVFEDMADLHL